MQILLEGIWFRWKLQMCQFSSVSDTGGNCHTTPLDLNDIYMEMELFQSHQKAQQNKHLWSVAWLSAWHSNYLSKVCVYILMVLSSKKNLRCERCKQGKAASESDSTERDVCWGEKQIQNLVIREFPSLNQTILRCGAYYTLYAFG